MTYLTYLSTSQHLCINEWTYHMHVHGKTKYTYIYIYIYIRENPNLIMLRTNKQINGEIATQEHKTRQNKGV